MTPSKDGESITPKVCTSGFGTSGWNPEEARCDSLHQLMLEGREDQSKASALS